MLDFRKIKSHDVALKLEKVKQRETVKKVYRPCKEIYRQLSLDWNGMVTGCCGDYDDYLTVDSIDNATLNEIWNTSKKLMFFRGLLDRNMHRSLTLCSTCYFAYDEF